MFTKRWLVLPEMSTGTAQALRMYPRVVAQLLYNRQIETPEHADSFLQTQLTANNDPFLLLDLAVAVERMITAINANEPIVVYGDYDVDGVTAAALLVQVLQAYQAQVQVYIPNRFDEGYGLNKDALSDLSQRGTRLVITVDCGIRSLAEADHARALGLDLIITDHHHVGETIPNALAVINPKRLGDPYPEKMLAGVGVAFKLACGLMEKLGQPAGLTKAMLLDLVALGTVADLAPLVGENRVLVHWGLRALNQTRRTGLLALINVSRLTVGKIKSGQIGFQLGPRLNAAGRLNSALAAYELLTTHNAERANELASHLDAQNLHRQELTEWTTERARQLATTEPDQIVLFAIDSNFNPGVVGLAAARLMQDLYRPSFVGHIDSEHVVGSARSIPEFHITEALDLCADLLERYGGHAVAAGFTVLPHNLPLLQARLRRIAQEQLANCDLRPLLRIDLEVSLSELSLELLQQLQALEPYGYGNPTPILLARNLIVREKRTISDGKHLKLRVQEQGSTALFDCIGFQLGGLIADLPPLLDAAFEVEINEWQGKRTVQLSLRDVRPALLG